jgi:aspartate racemase
VVAATGWPYSQLVEETARAVRGEHPRARRVGVLAASGALDAHLYERVLEPLGLEVMVPTGDARARFMEGIWAIKAGNLYMGRTIVAKSAQALVDAGVDLVIAGCTEVPLVLGASDLVVPLVDATDVLAYRAVAYARGEALPQD